MGQINVSSLHIISEKQAIDVFDKETGVWRSGEVNGILDGGTYSIHYLCFWSRKNDEVVPERYNRHAAPPPH